MYLLGTTTTFFKVLNEQLEYSFTMAGNLRGTVYPWALSRWSTGGCAAGQCPRLWLRPLLETALLACRREVLPTLRAGSVQREWAVSQTPHKRQSTGLHRMGWHGNSQRLQVNGISHGWCQPLSHAHHIHHCSHSLLIINHPYPFSCTIIYRWVTIAISSHYHVCKIHKTFL